jgi:hypothetical protein
MCHSNKAGVWVLDIERYIRGSWDCQKAEREKAGVVYQVKYRFIGKFLIYTTQQQSINPK